MPRFSLPEKFESGDFAIFKKAFERVAKANKWDDSEQLAALPLALSGRALLAFEAQETSFTTVSDAFKHLTEEFNAALDKESAMKQFYACRWGNGLDPAVFANQLKGLLLRGLPSLSDDDVQRIVCNQLINSFPSTISEKLRTLFAGKSPVISDVAAAARDMTRDSGSESQACALQQESEAPRKMGDLEAKINDLAATVAALANRNMDESKYKDSGSRSRRNNLSRGRGRSEIRCFNCSGLGHIARNCPSSRNQQRRSSSGNAKAGDRAPTTSLQ